MASDNAEVSARANTQLAIRDLAEATGGFLIGDSNDLRGPLRQVNEEIASYYELSFNPGIQNYDGSFRKLSVNTSRKNLVIHARNGYFALPPEARACGTDALRTAAAQSDLRRQAFRGRGVPLRGGPASTEGGRDRRSPAGGGAAAFAFGQSRRAAPCLRRALLAGRAGEGLRAAQVVKKFSRDRSFHVTAEQLKAGNFVDKLTVNIPPGKYTLDAAVMDRESGKTGVERSTFDVAPKAKGVGISSLTVMHSYTPNAKGLDPDEPFQFQGGSVTPTLDAGIQKGANAMLRLFFTVYQDASISARPTVEVQFVQGGKVLANVPMELPAADASGRIPYLMTIPAAAIPPGDYQIRATARQGNTASETSTMVRFLP